MLRFNIERSTMRNIQLTAEVFGTAFGALKKRERSAVVERLIGDKEFIEDLFDHIITEQRKRESSRLLEECLADRKKRSA